MDNNFYAQSIPISPDEKELIKKASEQYSKDLEAVIKAKKLRRMMEAFDDEKSSEEKDNPDAIQSCEMNPVVLSQFNLIPVGPYPVFIGMHGEEGKCKSVQFEVNEKDMDMGFQSCNLNLIRLACEKGKGEGWGYILMIMRNPHPTLKDTWNYFVRGA